MDYFQNLNWIDLTYSKNLWKTIKPFFGDESLSSKKIMLREKEVLISDEKAVDALMKKYFIDITVGLNL